MNTLEITQCLKKDPYAKAIFKQVNSEISYLTYPDSVIHRRLSSTRSRVICAVNTGLQFITISRDFVRFSIHMVCGLHSTTFTILYFKHHVVLNTIHSNYKVSRRVCVAIIAFTSLCSKLADSVYMRL